MHAAPESFPSDVLRMTNVRFGYQREVAVIEGVTATLTSGRLTVMIGPNAAGKSTMLRLMLGQLQPWSGHVALDGHPVASLAPAQRARRIAYVPQRGGVSFAFTVRQVVEMGRFAQPSIPGAVDEALAQCDLAAVADRVFAHLSGGQQQRVLLARAIAQLGRATRGVLLADEPASSMDLLHLQRTMDRLRDLAAAGLAVLVVLHDLSLAARYADEVWLVQGGRLLASGPWETVLDPKALSDVYQVRLAAVAVAGEDRPVLVTASTPMDGTIEQALGVGAVL